MGLDNLWKPDLRGRIEQGISRIAAGQVTKDTVRGGSATQ
jgi:DNA topoisomerase-3